MLRVMPYAASTPIALTMPAGTLKRRRSRRNGTVGGRPTLGATASRKAGMPTVNAPASERWRGSRGYASPATPIVRISTAANELLTTNSFATRRMFERIRRPSATPCGSDENEPFSSTMSLTPFAICEPEPSAIDIRAAFIAGTSLTPSPIIAT